MPSLPSLTRLRRPTTKPAAVGAAVLALALVAAPFVPRDAGPPHAIAPSGQAAGAAGAPGLGELTPAMQREIDRVVAAGRDVGSAQGRTALARAMARCATFEGERYCLGVGWTTQTPEQVADRLMAPPTPGRERTGGLDAAALLARSARMSTEERAATERAELTMAARSVAKVRLLRRELAARTGVAAYPTRKYAILGWKDVRSQKKYYWCGPAAMQAIAWGSQGAPKNQSYWARRLRTTSAGTGITDMVRVINNHTKYDNKKHAGPYVAFDIADLRFAQWYELMMRHVHDYQAPVVMHPVLLKQYFPYLDDDASGHFQVGRGFDQNPDGNPQVGYFEPWDQSRFDPSEPYIPRVQWRNAYRSYRANLEHFQHNMGL